MRVYHLNCVSACPLGGLLMDGVPAPRLRARLTSHCLLVDTGAELVLIDTGYGLRDVREFEHAAGRPHNAPAEPTRLRSPRRPLAEAPRHA